MKNILHLFILLLISLSCYSQNVLLINDNDNITQNTDTFIVAMQNSNYANYTYYDAAASSQMPSSAFLQNFDIIIYYASTDGSGLGIWDNGQNGNNALRGFLTDGGRAWLIGADILYAGSYSTPVSFADNSFAYEYMGLASYNVQSYGDDGSTGVSQVNYTNTTSFSFPDSLLWSLGTLWWVDGVTSRANGLSIYQMGPSTYALAGETCMTHFYDLTTNVMSTFFDPALISEEESRIDFINTTLDYFWQFDLGISDNLIVDSEIKIYPTLVNEHLIIERKIEQNQFFEVFSISGDLVKSGNLKPGTNLISTKELSRGMYLIKNSHSCQKFIKQ